jgi:glycosyltransferase involved in cell wall biosynthesis
MKNTNANDVSNQVYSKPFVSWILCSHVVNSHLKLSIESCLSQTYNYFELIFIANGPNALKVAQTVQSWYGTDSRVLIFMTEIHQLSFSLSLGLHHARGTLIARMDSDDISRSDRLERQVDFMSEHPEIAVLGTSYEIINDSGAVQRDIRMPQSDKSIRQGLLRGNPLCHPSVMFRRQVVLEAGGYLGGLHAEDYDLWARLSLNPKYQFANLNIICLGYRVIGVGIARRSRWAYASIAASQFRNFLIGGGVRWCFASFVSVGKLLLRSSPIRSLK